MKVNSICWYFIFLYIYAVFSFFLSKELADTTNGKEIYFVSDRNEIDDDCIIYDSKATNNV